MGVAFLFVVSTKKTAVARNPTPDVECAQLIPQLALFLDNKPGMLARVCELLAAAKINIYALSTSDTVDHIVVRLVVEDAVRAVRLFEEHGTLVVTQEVLMVKADSRPGSLGAIARTLSDARINIEYAYCATGPESRKGVLILRVNKPAPALKLLNNL